MVEAFDSIQAFVVFLVLCVIGYCCLTAGGAAMVFGLNEGVMLQQSVVDAAAYIPTIFSVGCCSDVHAICHSIGQDGNSYTSCR